MAKATLPTNFKDDVLASAMGGKRRYNMIHNSDGTVSFEDVTNYTQVGSTFGAAQINATNEAVNNAADASKIIDSLETIKANTQSGYIAGALAVKALNSNLGEVIKLPEMTCNNGNTTLNITPYTNKWKDLTADNFYIGIRQTNSARYGSDSHTRTFSKTYNSSTGVLTITNAYTYADSSGNSSGSGWLNKPTYISPLLILSNIKTV